MKNKLLKVFFTLSCSFFINLPFITAASKHAKVSCGNVTDIPLKVPQITTMVVNIMQVAVPVILIIMGSMDLFKGITAQKEDEIKKGQTMFIKRLITAAIVFFVVVISKLVVSFVAEEAEEDNLISCIDCFIVDTDKCSK